MTDYAEVTDARRDYVLAEFRCALIKAKLAQLDIEAIGCALKHRIITPEQAVCMFWGSDSVEFLGWHIGGGAR